MEDFQSGEEVNTFFFRVKLLFIRADETAS